MLGTFSPGKASTLVVCGPRPVQQQHQAPALCNLSATPTNASFCHSISFPEIRLGSCSPQWSGFHPKRPERNGLSHLVKRPGVILECVSWADTEREDPRTGSEHAGLGAGSRREGPMSRSDAEVQAPDLDKGIPRPAIVSSPAHTSSSIQPSSGL